MSILAKLNLADGQWTTNVQPESPSPDVEIGFHHNGSRAEFDNLAFGFTVTVDGDEKYVASYPPAGAKYISSDQRYISNDRVTLLYDDEATLSIWAENAGQRYEHSVDFVVPRPEQPYPSWVWNGEWWDPPVPYPDEGFYVWDEEAQEWAAADPNSEQEEI